jgi:hypothetical protein
MKSSANIIPCWLINHRRKLSHYRPRNYQRNQSYGWRMESSTHLIYCFPQESLTKLHCWPRNRQRNSVLRLALGLSPRIIYCQLKNHWWKLRHCRPRNHQCSLVLRLTSGLSTYIAYCQFRNCWWKLRLYRPRNHQCKLSRCWFRNHQRQIESFLVLLSP